MASSHTGPISTSAESASVNTASGSQRTSSRPGPSSSSATASSFKLPISSSPRPKSTPPPNTFTSTFISISSSPSTSSPASTDTQITPLSHRPELIAAIAASIVAGLLLASLAIVVYLRRSRRQHLASIPSTQYPLFRETSAVEGGKGWKESPAPSTVVVGWPNESRPRTASLALHMEGEQPRTRQSVGVFSVKSPHYTVRSHASMSDVYGFGQDIAWQEAHYENPLPVVPAVPSGLYPTLDVVPPTPSSVIIHPNAASATPLLRSHSAMSSVSSQYSAASMVFPDLRAPPEMHDPSFAPDRALAMDERDWLHAAPDVNRLG